MLYIIGPPGAGKSTLMAELTRGQRGVLAWEPFPHTWYSPLVAQLGYVRRDFSGTDALALSVQPRVEAWLQQRPYRVLLGEGDRLANDKFFRAVQAAGYELQVVYLEGQGVAQKRRDSRALALGRPLQDETWVKGRVTKAMRLAVAYDALALPAALPPDGWAEILEDGGWHPFRQPQEARA